jgi:hypothetical protein
VLQEERIVLSSHGCKERRQTRYNLVCTDKHRPADEDGRDHIPVFLGNVVEEIKAVTQRGIGEIFEAISMNLQGSAGGSQLVQINSNFPTFATGIGKEDGDGDRSRGIVRDSGGLRGAAKGKEDEAEYCNKHIANPSHGQPPCEIV